MSVDNIRSASIEASTDPQGRRWLTISNPPRNLLDPTLMIELRTRLEEADNDDDVRLTILRGSGDWFCGGLDTAQIQKGADPLEFAANGIALMKTFPQLGKPVLAAVNGNAMALGYAIVAACDLAIAAHGSELGCFEATVGLWPMTSQIAPMMRRVPTKWIMENILTGDGFSAERAAETGIVNRVVPADQLDEEIASLADRAVRAGAAIPIGRRAFYRFLDLGYDEAHDQALGEFEAMFDALRSAHD